MESRKYCVRYDLLQGTIWYRGPWRLFRYVWNHSVKKIKLEKLEEKLEKLSVFYFQGRDAKSFDANFEFGRNGKTGQYWRRGYSQ